MSTEKDIAERLRDAYSRTGAVRDGYRDAARAVLNEGGEDA